MIGGRSPRAGAAMAGLAAAIALLAAGCSSAGADKAPNWSVQPDFPGDGGGAPDPGQAVPAPPHSGSHSSAPASPVPPPGGSTGPAIDPNVVATRLDQPIGIAVLPDTSALVGERSTGRILRVQPKAGQPVQVVRTLTGLDTSAGGGLLDLALSPSYAEDDLIFAYITTPTDNRVIDFTLDGPATAVLTGIPRGATDNTGRIMFGADGALYVATGDAGHAQPPTSLAGKVLRISAIGRPATGNPSAASPVLAAGTHSADGLCTDPTTKTVYETEAQPSASADLVREIQGRGFTQLRAPTAAAGRGIGGCAVDAGVLYIASRDGAALLGARIDTRGNVITLGPYAPYLKGKYGRLITVVTAPDGSLWLATSNRDGHGRPVADDDRIVHIQPPAGGATSPA